MSFRTVGRVQSSVLADGRLSQVSAVRWCNVSPLNVSVTSHSPLSSLRQLYKVVGEGKVWNQSGFFEKVLGLLVRGGVKMPKFRGVGKKTSIHHE